MAYFDGDLHGWNGPDGYHAGRPQTRLYCDPCAEEAIPLPATGPNGDRVGRHWATDFKWAPRYGSLCHCCGQPC